MRKANESWFWHANDMAVAGDMSFASCGSRSS